MRREDTGRDEWRRLGRPRYPGALTPRQRDVFELLVKGLTNEEIALQLGITEDGVKYHVSQILQRLGAENRHDAVALHLRTESKGWLAAWAPVMFLRRLPFAWLSKAAAGGALTAAAAGIALLAWGVMSTPTATTTTPGRNVEQSDAGNAAPGAPGVVQAAAGADAITAVSAGGWKSCALRGGGVWCWGSNRLTGPGESTGCCSIVPLAVAGLASGVTAISAAWGVNCAVKDGGVWCWRDNGSATDGPVPAPRLTSSVSAISTNGGRNCALRDGGVWCWTYDTRHLLGNATTIGELVPVPWAMSGLASGVSTISEGGDHGCAVKDGGVRCWDGWGTDGPPEGSPQTFAVPGLASGVSAISAGAFYTCAVKDGGAWCWGGNADGQLGNNGRTDSPIPVAVSALPTGVSAISAGQGHSCAVKEGGVWCWGNNSSGQLGNNSTTDSNVPVAVSDLTSGVSAISAASGYSCALKDYAVWCWGRNYAGQLGNNSTTDSPVPVRVQFPPASAGDVAAAPDAKPSPSHPATDSADHRTAYVLGGSAAAALAIVVAGMWAMRRRRIT